MSTADYIDEVPASVPAGKVLVHNHIKPQPAKGTPGTMNGTNGFRFWLDDPQPGHYVECDCGWAAHLAHHRVYRPAHE